MHEKLGVSQSPLLPIVVCAASKAQLHHRLPPGVPPFAVQGQAHRQHAPTVERSGAQEHRGQVRSAGPSEARRRTAGLASNRPRVISSSMLSSEECKANSSQVFCLELRAGL